MSDVDTATEATTVPASVSAEIAVMRRLVNALESVDQPTQRRVLTWLNDRYQLGGEAGT